MARLPLPATTSVEGCDFRRGLTCAEAIWAQARQHQRGGCSQKRWGSRMGPSFADTHQHGRICWNPLARCCSRDSLLTPLRRRFTIKQLIKQADEPREQAADIWVGLPGAAPEA